MLGVGTRLPDPVAVTFYDDPVQLLGSLSSEADQSCPDVTPPDAAPMVFAARDNPSLYHLLRCSLGCYALAFNPKVICRCSKRRACMQSCLHNHAQPRPCQCRVQLLPIFLALNSFGLQDGAFQIVFTDSRPRDWYPISRSFLKLLPAVQRAVPWTL